MSQFNISWQRIPSLLSTIRISDILDILVVAYLIYKLIMLIRRTNSFHLARGVLLILVALGLSGVMNLTMVNRLRKNANGRMVKHRTKRTEDICRQSIREREEERRIPFNDC